MLRTFVKSGRLLPNVSAELVIVFLKKLMATDSSDYNDYHNNKDNKNRTNSSTRRRGASLLACTTISQISSVFSQEISSNATFLHTMK